MNLAENTCYHIYNHANGNENLFREVKNYHFFLEKYNKYIEPIADTIAYCLMPNHFHLLIKTRISDVSKNKSHLAENKISDVFENIGYLSIADEKEKEISKNIGYLSESPIQYANHFKNLFQSYTKSYNKLYKRKGSLFIQRFKRKEIDSVEMMQSVIIYIHLNPVLHGFSNTPDQWKFSSYNAYLAKNGKSKVAIDEGLTYFDNIKNFRYCHNERMLQDQQDKFEEVFLK